MTETPLEKFPWWLQGNLAQSLHRISSALWRAFFDLPPRLLRQSIASRADSEGENLFWDDLQVEYALVVQTGAEKQAFVEHYDKLKQSLGTLQGILLAQKVFQLAFFRCIVLRETPLAPLYPFHYLRVLLDARVFADHGRLLRVREFLRRVAPARCKFHTDFAPHVEPSGFGHAPTDALHAKNIAFGQHLSGTWHAERLERRPRDRRAGLGGGLL